MIILKNAYNKKKLIRLKKEAVLFNYVVVAAVVLYD